MPNIRNMNYQKIFIQSNKFVFIQSQAGIPSVDQSEDPQLAPVYASDIYQYLLNYEAILSIPKNYLQGLLLFYTGLPLYLESWKNLEFDNLG